MNWSILCAGQIYIFLKSHSRFDIFVAKNSLEGVLLNFKRIGLLHTYCSYSVITKDSSLSLVGTIIGLHVHAEPSVKVGKLEKLVTK